MKILEITNLYKKYENLDVLSDINVNLNKGEFVSIVGPSGCGKSTLFKIITGLDKEFEGLCLLEETDVKNYKTPLAYMPQKDLLLPWRTLYENIILPLELHSLKINLDQINLMIEDFGLKGFEDYYPKDLSGGMKQRAALLRTFLINSEIILLDEPFGALDAITRINLQEWLSKICKKYNHTVLFITHDIEEALYLSDRIYVIGKRPGTILKEFSVNFELRESVEDTINPDFFNIKKEILNLLY